MGRDGGDRMTSKWRVHKPGRRCLVLLAAKFYRHVMPKNGSPKWSPRQIDVNGAVIMCQSTSGILFLTAGVDFIVKRRLRGT